MKIVILGDLHFPYHNKKALKKALQFIKKEKPDYVVQIGDLYDQYSFSRFTKRNITLPSAELKRARKAAVAMWDDIRRFSHYSRCIQMLGNHDIRLIKRVEEKLPEAQDLVKEKILELYQFKGVKTYEDDRTVIKIGGIAFHHGYLSKLGDHKRVFGKSTVVGHSHVGGVVYESRNGKIIWELNAGYLADENAEPLRYQPTKTSKWTLGVGLIDCFGPRFIPFGK